MSETVISVENLSKKYVIGHQRRERYTALRDVIVETAVKWGRRIAMRPVPDPTREEIWALKDISFEVKQGERVGIIGRNGAGKSTLLKLLSRITYPTSGRIKLRGRVASLLEVGTGFHSELTGRENIYLSGAILGMSKTEIDRKFDEIVAFAEVEKFLDTPVKRFSSGMCVRLAFAVAVHLDPEILLVDEVLAVGDSQFQKKCLGRMEQVANNNGRTVFFVSHSMNAIERLCSRCLLLEKGQIISFSEDVRSVIKSYIFPDRDIKTDLSKWINTRNEYENPWFKPIKFYFADANGCEVRMPISNDSDTWIYIQGEIREIDKALNIGYAIYSEEGSLLYLSYFADENEELWPTLKEGNYIIKSKLPKRFLNEGIYKVELVGGIHYKTWLFEPGVNCPSVYLRVQGGLSDSPFWVLKRPGMLAPVIKWDSENLR